MSRIFFETLEKEVEKISEEYCENLEIPEILEILYHTNRDVSCEYVRISETPIYGKERYFITASIDIYSTCNTMVASITIPP